MAFGLHENIRAEEALTSALERFCAQVERIEASLSAAGKDWQDLSEAEEISLWENL